MFLTRNRLAFIKNCKPQSGTLVAGSRVNFASFSLVYARAASFSVENENVLWTSGYLTDGVRVDAATSVGPIRFESIDQETIMFFNSLL